MRAQPLTCTNCRAVLPKEIFNLGGLTPCPSCSTPIRVEVFPALFQAQTGKVSENILVEGESGCFYHPEKKAEVPCDGCGRFLCALCDLELNDGHYCPTCLEKGRTKGKFQNLDRKRTLYDQIALSLTIVPMFICLWPSLVCAPIALFIALRFRNHPGSIVRPTKIRFTVAAILASLQILGWICFFIFLAVSITE